MRKFSCHWHRRDAIFANSLDLFDGGFRVIAEHAIRIFDPPVRPVAIKKFNNIFTENLIVNQARTPPISDFPHLFAISLHSNNSFFLFGWRHLWFYAFMVLVVKLSAVYDFCLVSFFTFFFIFHCSLYRCIAREYARIFNSTSHNLGFELWSSYALQYR